MRYLLLSLFLICFSSFAVSQDSCKSGFLTKFKLAQEKAKNIGTDIKDSPLSILLGGMSAGLIAGGITADDPIMIATGAIVGVNAILVTKSGFGGYKRELRKRILEGNENQLNFLLSVAVALPHLSSEIKFIVENLSKIKKYNINDTIDLTSINSETITSRGSPMHMAAYANNTKAIKILRELGADIQTKNADGKTPKDLAIENKSRKAVKILEKIEKAEQAEQAKKSS